MFNHSPWLDFPRTHWDSLKSDLKCDVVLVGAGISGIATLYYLLTSTQRNAVLIEKNRVASGATGHNAGLAVVAIEKSTSELVKIIGKEAVCALYEELNEAWDELHAIHEEIGLKDNLLSFPHGAGGCTSLSSFFSSVQNSLLRGEQKHRRFVVANHLKHKIPQELSPFIECVSHQFLLDALKTIDTSYIAGTLFSSVFKGKRMNSALFCHRVLDYLQMKFPHRFSVYEQTAISKIELYPDHVVLEHARGTIQAQDAILCTNAYKNFSLWDPVHQRSFTKVQEGILPRIGYLTAFPDSSPHVHAVAFINENPPFNASHYWYFSSAPHPKHNPNHACVIGGPEYDLPDVSTPEQIESKGKESLSLIQQFLKHTFGETPSAIPFFWHGWMGYTSNGLRWVGPDPDYPHLWYNLACNGIGIVSALAGGKKIATQMESLEKK